SRGSLSDCFWPAAPPSQYFLPLIRESDSLTSHHQNEHHRADDVPRRHLMPPSVCASNVEPTGKHRSINNPRSHFRRNEKMQRILIPIPELTHFLGYTKLHFEKCGLIHYMFTIGDTVQLINEQTKRRSEAINTNRC